jgi:predicted dehydrogenase
MARLTRRRFVSATAAGLVASPAASSLASPQSTSPPAGPSDRIRVAVIGCGGMGRAHLNDFQRHADAQIVAVCDVWQQNLDRAVQLTSGQKTGAAQPVRDFRRVLERRDIDAVVVATPDNWHPLITVLACQAGKDVYVEKPVSITVREGRRMVEAARAHKRVVQVGTQQRSGRHFQAAVQLMRDGGIGRVHRATCWNTENNTPYGMGKPADEPVPEGLDWDLWLGPAPEVPFNPNRFLGSFRNFWDYAGGTMTDWGVHHLDIVNWVYGVDAPKSVYMAGARFIDDNGETPDSIDAVYEYPDAIVTYVLRNTNAHAPDRRQSYGMVFYGTDATLYLDRSGYEILPELEPWNSQPPVRTYAGARRAPAVVEPWNRPHRSRAGRIPAVRAEGSDQNLTHIRNFLDCVKSRALPASDIEIGHRSTTTAILANMSYRTGRKLVWDRVKEEVMGDGEANRLLDRPYRAPWTWS